jgi:eukaryotic-like serine/threonine-protein kinase
MKVDAGARLGHYEIVAALGKGGMGEVYLAHDIRLDRRVALKILPAGSSVESDRLTRFIREAKAASALNHPNIITVYDIGETAGTHFIVYEFIEGRTLREVGNGGPVSVASALEIGIQIASALVEAHGAGIIHRDLKPDNVMIRASGLVKLLDFGIARLTRPAENAETDSTVTSRNELTQQGVVIGTPQFMSPEQARGTEVNQQTDIFSFGAILYELLSGRSPFAAGTVADVLAAVLTREPPRLIGVPPRLADVVARAMQKDRSQRYQTAAEVLRDLTELRTDPAGQTKTVREVKSVAVLPFTNMSATEDNEHFCDGLAEELLNALSKIDALNVAARTSAFSFKGKNGDVGTIARTLGVDTIIEGSVRRSGNRLRISVQMINASDGYQIWSERYDREMGDIFALQDDITLAVVEALKLKLLSEERAAVLRRYTDNAEAYELFLKGRYHSHKYTAQGWHRSIDFFEKAIAIEPAYALAFAGIAMSRAYLWYFGLLPAEQTIPQAKAAIRQALAVDDGLGDAHQALARLACFYDWDWQVAEQHFRRALALNPNSAEAYSGFAMFLAVVGRADEAITIGIKALRLDPLSPLIGMDCGWTLFSAGMSTAAAEQAAKMTESDQDFYGGYWLQGAIHLSEGDFEPAVEHLRTAVTLGGHPVVIADLASACILAGRDEEAAAILRQLIEMRRDQYVPATCLARVYGRLGQTEQALEWLETAFAERNGEMVFLREEITTATSVDPIGRLAAEPRVMSLLQKMNLPPVAGSPAET